ncbi:hypothetical protein G5I_04815 [Acromyrmex echinatior]|uniref:Uncharacterized protein n=1 Tax=Acromyrmex echinatior TaxID=103372 RepID=F4WGN0_ACREC|nr:hypothetical protein G5I_04815 [Acromyrmex echinatior]
MFPWDIGSRCTEQDPAKRIVGGSVVDRAWCCVASNLKLPYISSVTFTGTIPGSPFPVYSRLENSKSSNKVTHSRCIVESRSRPRSVDKSLFLPYPYPTANNESFIYELSTVKRDRVAAFNFTTIVDERPFDCPPTATCSRASRTLSFPIDKDMYSDTIAETIKFLQLVMKDSISRFVSAIPRGIQYSLSNQDSLQLGKPVNDSFDGKKLLHQKQINQQGFNLIRRLYIILSAVSFCSTFELSNMLASYITQ